MQILSCPVDFIKSVDNFTLNKFSFLCIVVQNRMQIIAKMLKNALLCFNTYKNRQIQSFITTVNSLRYRLQKNVSMPFVIAVFNACLTIFRVIWCKKDPLSIRAFYHCQKYKCFHILQRWAKFHWKILLGKWFFKFRVSDFFSRSKKFVFWP